ncbi:MAG: hypothetical protein US60_C0038G0013 [Microgenomates group bacterium GW2011_GWC1_37_8]|nr:MAG: hypothetical protein US60_C0038G0013 [Microgenomates group bacterium GW2011_GWC1_37_8]
MAEKKNKKLGTLPTVLLILLAVVLLFAGAYIWKITPRPYSAVVLTNGDIYFGQVSYFPKFSLTNAYILQIASDPNNPEQAVPQIVPTDLLLWAPEKLVLNRDQVLSISEVGEDSQVMELIRSRSAVQ